MLGGLEQKVMEALWSSDTPLKPSEVLIKVNGDHAYTTIMTVLKRMADKKLVKREMKKRVYYYQAVDKKCEFATKALDDLFERLFSSYGDHTVTAFKKIAQKYDIKL
jgi:predicted transcriptional regulator